MSIYTVIQRIGYVFYTHNFVQNKKCTHGRQKNRHFLLMKYLLLCFFQWYCLAFALHVYCNDKGFPTLHASRFDRILVVIEYTTLLVSGFQLLENQNHLSIYLYLLN